MTSKNAKTILIVLTSHDQLGASGRPTGYWLSELTHVYAPLQAAGYAIDIASPKGGLAPMDPASKKLSDATNRVLMTSGDFIKKITNTQPVTTLRASDYAAIYFPGGHGPMWDLAQDAAVAELTKTVYEAGGIVAAVCHGPAALLPVRLSDGTPLLANHTVAGLRNLEERLAGKAKWVPFLLEDRLREQAKSYSKGFPGMVHCVVSGRIITGQNPASAKRLGELLVNALQHAAD